MIKALNDDDLIARVGGKFRLCSLIQKRWLDIMQGSRPMVDPAGLTELEVVVEEIVQGKIGIDYPGSGLEKPDVA